jgi:predicted Rossmann-fold nucleotide-binding protein
MKRITVFCGSSAGIDSTFISQAAFGQTLAKHKIELVYGVQMLDLWNSS